MVSERVRLAAVLAMSAAFASGCHSNNCRDAQGRAVRCGGMGGHGSGAFFGRGGVGGEGEASGVTRGGFGGTGEGVGGFGGGGE